MSNNSTAVSNVIPFRFDKKEVRTLLIDDQPWFVAVDVCNSLSIVNVTRALSRLDDDEKALHSMKGARSMQELNVVNESGLYSLILTSRKEDARRFKKWITSAVLPAIRKHGHYVDYHGAMGDLVGAVIGTSGEHVLDRVIDQKASPVPHSLQRSFKHTMKSRLRSRFNVQRTALIPAECLSEACNFVVAYALEGEWIGRQEKGGIVLSDEEVGHLYLLMSRHFCLMKDREAILSSARSLESRALMRVFDQINEGRSSFAALDARRSEIYGIYRSNGASPGGYAIVA
ncbi:MULTISPECIES: Bro-N domain-containing protein [Pseudomonas]|uniref:Phage repressor protein n=1 Tax=Pseudomonas rhodesiae TaxID=76760 RepID=A0A8I1EBE4_9PSED|nr:MULTISPECIES: BRO family protein [Pseudomonas]MBI6605165.1 phage repressor protein [Pseudomonas sp. S4_EA_1b]MBI6628169.1 phage repressor protein [Pseudomonas rhodesiae]